MCTFTEWCKVDYHRSCTDDTCYRGKRCAVAVHRIVANVLLEQWIAICVCTRWYVAHVTIVCKG